jgi:hypothetical protein
VSCDRSLPLPPGRGIGMAAGAGKHFPSRGPPGALNRRLSPGALKLWKVFPGTRAPCPLPRPGGSEANRGAPTITACDPGCTHAPCRHEAERS